MKTIKGFNKVIIGESLKISVDLFSDLLNVKKVIVKMIKHNYKDSFNYELYLLEDPILNICDRIKNYLDDYVRFKKESNYLFRAAVFDDIVLEISKPKDSEEFYINLFKYEPIFD